MSEPDTMERRDHAPEGSGGVIWMYGQEKPLRFYKLFWARDGSVPGGDDTWNYSAGDPVLHPDLSGDDVGAHRHQIVLHFTSSNNEGWQMMHNTWNRGRVRELQRVRPNLALSAAELARRFPDDDDRREAVHAKRVSTNYMIERGEHRADPNSPHADIMHMVDPDLRSFHADNAANSIGIEHANSATDTRHGVRTFPNSPEDWIQGEAWNRRRHAYVMGNLTHPDRNQWCYLNADGMVVSHRPNGTVHPLQRRRSAMGNMQAVDDSQYLACITLLRYLCQRYRIPRAFWGETLRDKFRLLSRGELTTQFRGRPARNQLPRFRGIYAHRNTSSIKPFCGGVQFSRNRLFRGLTDEWWLPVELEGAERPYYMGPFESRPHQRSFVRWRKNLSAEGVPAPVRQFASDIGQRDSARVLSRFEGGGTPRASEEELAQRILEADVDLEAFHETKSYVDAEQADAYYDHVEGSVTADGCFPLGTNRVWHGGVHFYPNEQNPKVYAAASGIIVAARLEPEEPARGSHRFVLIRHCVYHRSAGDDRIDYSQPPTYVHSLYMHLAPLASPGAADAYNPPWFNKWLGWPEGSEEPEFPVKTPEELEDSDRHVVGGVAVNREKEHPREDPVGTDSTLEAPPTEEGGGESRVPSGVFYPNVEVMVGDWIGAAGRFGERSQVLHFEVFSKGDPRQAQDADDGISLGDEEKVLRDSDRDVLCDSEQVDQVLSDAGVSTEGAFTAENALEAAQQLRVSRILKRSEWSIWGQQPFYPLVQAQHPSRSESQLRAGARAEWEQWAPYMWIQEFRDAQRESYDLAFGERPAEDRPDSDTAEGEDNAPAFAWHYHPISFILRQNARLAADTRPRSS